MHDTFTNSLIKLSAKVFGVIIYSCVAICHTYFFTLKNNHTVICDPLELCEMIN